MARKAWNIGWPEYEWAPPIEGRVREREIEVAVEQQTMKTKAREEAQAIVNKAERLAAEASEREAKSLEDLSKMVLECGNGLHALAGPMTTLMDSTGRAIEAMASGEMLDVTLGMGLIDTYSKVTERFAKANSVLMEANRFRAGKPTSITGLELSMKPMTVEEHEVELRRLAKGIEAAKRSAAPFVEEDLGEDA